MVSVGDKVVLVKLVSGDEEASSESSFAFSWCLHEVKEAFGSENVRLERVRPDAHSLDLEGVGAVLLMQLGDILVGRRTLKALMAALHDGADMAFPYLLGRTRAAKTRPPNTLRDLERIEGELLEGAGSDEPSPSPPFPVALFRPRFLRDALERSSTRTPGDPDLVTGEEARDRGAVRGVCHQYQDYYGETREDIVPFLPASATEVLEVGCGRGFTGALLQERLGCRVTGVELNPAAARDASRRLFRVVRGDILEVPLQGPFDAIVALELFEHLVDGDRFLERAGELLSPEGVLVLSVPNVGYHAIVSDLLAGRWDYIPIGLLCYTHVRFFTRRTLADWLERCGFRRHEISAQKDEVPGRLATLATELEADLESLATSGFYVVARPDP